MRTFGLVAMTLSMVAIISVAPAAEDVDVSGKWSGTWSTARASGPCTLELDQKGRDLTGDVHIANRPISPTSYTAAVKGSVKGRGGALIWTPPAQGVTQYTVHYEFTLSEDGTLTGTGKGARGIDATLTLKRSQ